MKKLLLATHNQGKVREFRRLLDDIDQVEVLSLADLGETYDVIEDGDTFEKNAAKKARELAQHTGMMTLADDSGLEVDALDGAPGVYSARYAGADGDDEANNRKLLDALKDVPDEARTARFVCVLAFVDPARSETDPVQMVRGECEGTILHAAQGALGFGYDPLFLTRGQTVSNGELDPAIKNQISHRAQASRAMVAFLGTYLAER